MSRDDHPPPTASGYFESMDSFAHLVRHDGAPAPPAGAPRDAATVGNATGAAAFDEPPPGDAQPAALVYRPTRRHPLALLHVVDDGRDDGEVVRLRGDTFVIGRSEGDVVIGHDLLMSPRHACLERCPGDGWRLTDLGSARGTFVRVTRATLRHKQVIQIGRTRMRFHEVDLTEAWLIELQPGDERDGPRHECQAPLTEIGRTGSTIALEDPFVSDLHAVLKKRKAGGWSIRNHGLNGLWVSIDKPRLLPADQPSQFLCGEQRFVFEPLG